MIFCFIAGNKALKVSERWHGFPQVNASRSRTEKLFARRCRFEYIYLAEVIIKPDLRSLSTGGVILVFGQGDVGQLGLGAIVEKLRPAVVPDYQDIVAAEAGGMHNVCLKKTGEIFTFGCNDEGALGRDTSKEGSETVPGIVELPGKAIQVTAGDSHSAALLEDGRAFAWGSFRVRLSWYYNIYRHNHVC